MRISDWSSDVCSSDLRAGRAVLGWLSPQSSFERVPGSLSLGVGTAWSERQSNYYAPRAGKLTGLMQMLERTKVGTELVQLRELQWEGWTLCLVVQEA